VDNLLNPDTGLIIWTMVTFLVLVVVLGRFAWKPLLKVLDEREQGIRRDIEEAQAAKLSAAQMREQYEQEVARGQEKIKQLITQATTDAQKLREKMLREAEEEAARAAAMHKRQLEEEKEKVMRDVRKEVAAISVRAAEKLLRREMNPKAQEDILNDFFEELDKGKFH